MDEPSSAESEVVSRRSALLKLGGLATGVIGAGFGARELLDASPAEAAGTGPAAVAAGLVRCVLTPEQTEDRNGGSRSTLRLVKNGSAYVGSLAMGVQRS